jgi:hypothetical protein
MTEAVRGDLDQIVDGTFNHFLEQQAEEFGDDNLDPNVLEGLDEEPLEEDSSQEDEPEGDEAEEAVGAGKRSGTDEVVARLRRADPEAAELFLEMQRKMSRNTNETGALQQEILALRSELLERLERVEGGGEGTPAAERKLPEGITEENVRIFKEVADYLGLVPREELAKRDVESVSGTHVQRALLQGVERFGDQFGSVDDEGNVTLNPSVAARLQRRMEQLQDPKRGITPLDLFILEYGGRPRAGKAGARPTAAQTPARRSARPVRQSQVVRRSGAGTGSQIKIYDPKRGDDPSDVIDRAWAVAKRNLLNT